MNNRKHNLSSKAILRDGFFCACIFLEWNLGLQGGISIPNLSAGGSDNNPLKTGYSSRLGPEFAIFGEYHVSSLFSLVPKIEYSAQGGKKDGFQAMTTPTELARQR